MTNKDIIKIINESFIKFIDSKCSIQKDRFFQDVSKQLDILFEDSDLSIDFASEIPKEK